MSDEELAEWVDALTVVDWGTIGLELSRIGTRIAMLNDSIANATKHLAELQAQIAVDGDDA